MTVKPKTRGRPKGQGLSKDRILMAATSMLKQEGKVPSIRKLAATLEVDGMAIYHYFDNKAALLEGVTISVMEEIYQPVASENWQEQLLALSHSYLTLLKDYPGLLTTLLTMSDFGPAEVFSERFKQALKPLELSSQQLEHALSFWVDYLHGFALAQECNQSGLPLDVEMIAPSFNLFTLALGHLVNSD